jgi:ABC-2 type transport system ATP-binding protein
LVSKKDDKVNTYSGGMKRRLNLGVALLNQPDLLILDEPTAGVDMQSRDLIFENILKLKNTGVSLIYTTHYLEEIEKICGDIGVIHSGQTLVQTTVKDFKEKYHRTSIEDSYRDLLKERAPN